MEEKSTDQKIEILLRENQSFRNDQTSASKTLHTIAFSFLAFFGAFIVALINTYGKSPNLDAYQMSSFAFFISQIEFFVLLYAISISADITARAAYISHLEGRINELVSEKLVFWESDISIYERSKGLLFIVELVLGLFYAGVFGTLMFFSYNQSAYNWFFWLQTFEIIMILTITYILSAEYKNVINHIISNRNLKSKRKLLSV